MHTLPSSLSLSQKSILLFPISFLFAKRQGKNDKSKNSIKFEAFQKPTYCHEMQQNKSFLQSYGLLFRLFFNIKNTLGKRATFTPRHKNIQYNEKVCKERVKRKFLFQNLHFRVMFSFRVCCLF
jgi:hypothetical protein